MIILILTYILMMFLRSLMYILSELPFDTF